MTPTPCHQLRARVRVRSDTGDGGAASLRDARPPILRGPEPVPVSRRRSILPRLARRRVVDGRRFGRARSSGPDGSKALRRSSPAGSVCVVVSRRHCFGVRVRVVRREISEKCPKWPLR